ncbi:MAG: hypothetical protein ACRDYC_12005 [Acidimicrobiales bacterium]
MAPSHDAPITGAEDQEGSSSPDSPPAAPAPEAPRDEEGARSPHAPRETSPPGGFPGREPSAGFLFISLLAGLYATLPGFYAGGLSASRGTEVADHIVPGLIVLALVYSAARWPHSRPVRTLARWGLVLTGAWMGISQVSLVSQAVRGQSAWGPVVYHCSSAAAVVVVAAVWLWRYREPLPLAAPDGQDGQEDR